MLSRAVWLSIAQPANRTSGLPTSQRGAV
jgi:hypothetical protein